MQAISVTQSCILLPCWIHLSVLIVFDRVSCHLHVRIILPLIFQFGHFCSFSCLIAMARTSNTLLNRSESGNPCLVPDLKGNTFGFSPLNMISAVKLVINDLYYVETRSLYTKVFEKFYHDWLLNFVKCFSCIYWDDHVNFYPLFC